MNLIILTVRTRFLVICLGMVFSIVSQGQPLPPSGPVVLNPLTVGDMVPELTLTQVMNYPGRELRLSQLRGKLVIVDFWGTSCLSCLQALPRIQALQQQFAGKVQVLTVTANDTEEKVKQTLSRFRPTRKLNLPVVLQAEAPELTELFPHEMVSHVIWIGPDGRVKAITGSDYVTAENIKLALSGKALDWPVKKDVTDFDYDRPLLEFSQDSKVTRSPLLYYSSMSGYVDGIDGTDRLIVDSVNGIVTRNHYNHTLLQFCDGSLNGSGTGYIDPKKLVLEVKDPNRYILGKQFYAEWAKANSYCYSVALPITASDAQTQTFIREDLTRWLRLLGITVKKEKRTLDCLLLQRTGKGNKALRSSLDRYELSEEKGLKTLRGANVGAFLAELNQLTDDIPLIIDETGIASDFRFDLTLRVNSWADIPALREELQSYGLDLIPGKKEIEVHVITEDDWHSR